MAEKNDGIKRWMGFKEETVTNIDAPVAGNSNALARVRELESQLSELRSRRDITALSKEEFEILATETAMTLIRTAQQRESKAMQTAERLVGESKRAAQAAVESAENKARSLLSQAESKGRRLLETAENDAREFLRAAEAKAEELLNTKRREGVAIVSTARKEAEQMINTALSDVASYRAWLSGVLSESERLYKIQTQSLDAATSAIAQSRGRLDAAQERLAQLASAVERTLDDAGRPRIPRREEVAVDANAGESKSAPRAIPSKKSASKKSTRRSR
jgi:vacuolar-type H+-ATPase subunit H